MEECIKALKNSEKKILVIGDVMLDCYCRGDTHKISPEAPVPVFNYESTALVPGGAANVAMNLASLNQEVCVMSVVGDDEKGAEVVKLMGRYGIGTDCILVERGRKTTVKTRLLAQNNQQLLRIDTEETRDIGQDTQATLIRMVKEKTHEFDAVLVSDYLKGVLTRRVLRKIIEVAGRCNIRVFIDMKGKSRIKYKGAYLVKLNKKELEIMTGLELNSDEQIEKAAFFLKQRLKAKCCLVTRGPEGMTFLDESDESYRIKAAGKPVYDVTGAGDTVLAVIGACYANGMEGIDCVKISNIAAGLKIGKVGTAVVSLEEIEAEIGLKGPESKCKILDWEAVLGMASRRGNRKVVFTNGCFDLIHIGHIRYLKKARELGDLLIVGVNSDRSVKFLKGERRPIMSEDERMELVGALECVDAVVKFDEKTPYRLIQLLKPDILAKGGDYLPEGVVGRDIVDSYGGRVEIIDLTEGKSTTGIIDKIISGAQ